MRHYACWHRWREVSIATCDIETDEKIRGVIVCVLAYCRFRRIDIEWFIEQKMKYNRLRPYMHGGRKY